MNRTITSTLLIVVGIVMAAPVYSAGHLKVGDIKDDAETSQATPPTPANRVYGNEQAKPAGMLVPAVQKARARQQTDSNEKKRGNPETEFKVEKGE